MAYWNTIWRKPGLNPDFCMEEGSSTDHFESGAMTKMKLYAFDEIPQDNVLGKSNVKIYFWCDTEALPTNTLCAWYACLDPEYIPKIEIESPLLPKAERK